MFTEREENPKLLMLGKRIKEIRLKLGNISQREFAAKIGLSHSYLSGVEKGRNNPGFSAIYNIAKKFKVNLYYLFFGNEPMFLKNKDGIPDIPLEKVFGEDAGEIRDLLWYLEHSKLVRHSILSVFSKFLYENKDNIEKDIKRTENKQSIIDILASNQEKED